MLTTRRLKIFDTDNPNIKINNAHSLNNELFKNIPVVPNFGTEWDDYKVEKAIGHIVIDTIEIIDNEYFAEVLLYDVDENIEVNFLNYSFYPANLNTDENSCDLESFECIIYKLTMDV